jgi:hypothetical protein
MRNFLDELEETSSCLDQCLSSIEISNAIDPFCVLGQPADATVTSTIVSVATAFYVTLISQMFPQTTSFISGLSV